MTLNADAGQFMQRITRRQYARILKYMFYIKLTMYGSSMETGGHPEIYESDLLDQEKMEQYQMSIGCAQWDILLGQ